MKELEETITGSRERVSSLFERGQAHLATMRGLVRTDPGDDLEISSILGLFNQNGPWPETLTDFDRAYLTAVYDSIPNLPAARKIGRVSEELRQIEDRREEDELREAGLLAD